MSNIVRERFETLAAQAEAALAQRNQDHPTLIQIGSATCEHAAGSRAVLDEFRKHVAASGRSDFVLRQTGCTGRCSREPIVGVFVPGQMPIKYERVDRELVHEIFTRHILKGEPLFDHVLDGPIDKPRQYEFLVCASARCGWKGRGLASTVLPEKLRAAGVAADKVRIIPASCFGACSAAQAGRCSHLLVRPDKILYRVATDADLDKIIQQHVLGGKPIEELKVHEEPVSQEFFDLYGDVAFFNRRGGPLEAARPRRRRFPDRRKMAHGRRRARADPLHHLQRR